jgi:hypothetical protein
LDAFPSEVPESGEPISALRRHPLSRTARARPEPLTVVATAAITSAGVTLMTMFLWNQGIAPPALALRGVDAVPASIAAVAQSPAIELAPSASADSINDRAPAAERATDTDRGAERAAAADSSRAVAIISEPDGARVTINGVGWGITPLTVRHLPRGDLHVRVTKSGYISEERLLRGDAALTTVRVALNGVH